ncbi:MAG: hypothetical protein ACTHLN_10650 [Tepidisphaeraceae bacterium]
MITPHELLLVLVLPLVASSLIAMLGRRFRVAGPLAIGVGFLLGYGLIGMPRLPPGDGSDWLFWVAVPITLSGAAAAFVKPVGSLFFGAMAGLVVYAVARPLVPGAISSAYAIEAAGVAALAGIVLCAGLRYAETRLSPFAVMTALWMTLSGSAVIVMSSNFRIGGLYGIAAAAAVAGVALARPTSVGAAVAVAVSLWIGSLACGRLYPDPGVTWVNVAVLLSAPLLLTISAALPIKRRWLRTAIGLAAVALAVASVTVPTALAAKHAAEDDPYAAMN